MRVSALLRRAGLRPNRPSWACAHSMRVSALLRPEQHLSVWLHRDQVPIPCGFQRCCGSSPTLRLGRHLFSCPFHAGFSAAAAQVVREAGGLEAPACPFHAGFSAAAANPSLNSDAASSGCPFHAGFSAAAAAGSPAGAAARDRGVPIPCGFQRCCGNIPGLRNGIDVVSAHSMRVSALLRRHPHVIPPLPLHGCPFHAGFSAAAARTCLGYRMHHQKRAHSMRVSALLRLFSFEVQSGALVYVPIPCGFQRCCGNTALHLSLTASGCPFHAGFSAAAACNGACAPVPQRQVPIPCGFQRCCGVADVWAFNALASRAHSMRVSALLRRSQRRNP